ncbi:MAG TPA: hypothetical protein VFJ90_07740 [Candidatus Didemnitutus sp.]|nr:hypothetical protein [Candidatus Didemnitutus sp.]
MRRKLSFTCILIAWLCANGAVWNVVQVVAWARMFRDYSRVMSASQALTVTLDGSAPCELCQISEKARDQARDQDSPAALASTDKLVLAYQVSATPLVVAAPQENWPDIAHDAGLIRTDPVPVPPPRA